MSAEFIQLISEANVPEEIATSLEGFDIALFARSCESADELELFIQHAIASAGVTQLPQKMLAKASIRLLFSRCRTEENLPHLVGSTSGGQPAAATAPAAQAPTPASTSWQEAWPAKLSAERTAELRRRFEEDYPTELLDSEVFPSSRLLALTSKMVAEKEIRWLPWRFRLSAKAQDENLMIRPKKLPRLQELSDLLLDEAPTRDIHDGPASYNMINQLLTLATNSIALCQGAHLGALKMYQKRFLRLCFTKYESASNLRGPTSLEAQSADKRAWEIIAELVNQHAWKLDDALHEMSEVRADLSSLLAPRATLPKQLLNHQETWRPRYPGRGRGGKAGGKWGKSKEDSRFAGGDRTERGGKGSKSGGKGKDVVAPGKWLSTIFMEGKKHTLCMRYQNGTCKDPAACRFLHRCAVPKPDGTACGGNHPAFQHVATPH